jgi:GT2 family glycosyltransferase
VDSVKANVKEQVVKWLSNKDELGLTQGLTVMPKKVFYKYVAKSRYAVDGKVYRHLNKDELEKANTRLVHLINKLVLKNAYTRNGRKLIAVASIEGDNSSCIDLHTHFLLEKPDSYTNEKFQEKVLKAIELSGEFEVRNPNYKIGKDSLDKQYRFKIEEIDAGWSGYITKKIDKLELNRLYFY